MNNRIYFITLFTLLFYSNHILSQERKTKFKAKLSRSIFLMTEPVYGVYTNTWYAYKLSNGEIALISEGKSKEIRSFIDFNCENNRYAIYASTNFGENIGDAEFEELVPIKVIDLCRIIQCRN